MPGSIPKAFVKFTDAYYARILFCSIKDNVAPFFAKYPSRLYTVNYHRDVLGAVAVRVYTYNTLMCVSLFNAEFGIELGLALTALCNVQKCPKLQYWTIRTLTHRHIRCPRCDTPMYIAFMPKKPDIIHRLEASARSHEITANNHLLSALTKHEYDEQLSQLDFTYMYCTAADCYQFVARPTILKFRKRQERRG